VILQKLVEYHRKGELSFKHVITFNMDEYVGTDYFRYFAKIYDHFRITQRT